MQNKMSRRKQSRPLRHQDDGSPQVPADLNGKSIDD